MKHNCGLKCVTLKNVGVKKGAKQLIESVSLELKCGLITAIIGANGAGKTTLLRAILGDISATGEICFNDHNGHAVEGIKIGYVPQRLDFDASSPVSVADLFRCAKKKCPAFFSASKRVICEITQHLKSAGCSDLANRRLGELSGGELQRILLALALDPVPDLLILDEPVSGVDAAGLEQFYETVSRLRMDYHMAIVLVSHDLQLVEKYADEVVHIGGTVISFGTPSEVFATNEFKKIFGSKLEDGGK